MKRLRAAGDDRVVRGQSTQIPDAVQLDFAAVGRILDAVQEAGLCAPAAYFLSELGSGINDRFALARQHRADLAERVNSACSWYATHAAIYSDAFAQRRHTALRQTADRAHRLAVQLETDDELIGGELARILSPPNNPSPTQIRKYLLELEQAARSGLARLAEAGMAEQAPLSGEAESKIQAFVADLGQAFETTYGQRPKIERNARGAPAGPFLAFVGAVVIEAQRQERFAALRLSGATAAEAEAECARTDFPGMTDAAITTAFHRSKQTFE